MRNSAIPASRETNAEGVQSANCSGNASSPGLGADRVTTESRCEPESDKRNLIVGNARREFTSAFGDLARGKRNWQVIAFALSAVLALQGFAEERP